LDTSLCCKFKTSEKEMNLTAFEDSFDSTFRALIMFGVYIGYSI
jgi:hypothetical protein